MENKVSFAEKTIIFKEGTEASNLYVVTAGEVICLKASKDRLIPIFVAKSGDIIGESAMIEGVLYTFSAVALTNVQVLQIPSYNFKRIFSESPKWLIELTLSMIQRYQDTSQLLAENKVTSSPFQQNADFTPEMEVEFKKILNQ
jgi:CRP-like cAMP-binding protein